MRGNTNANISGGGSSKEIKILNVVQTGTLTRDGAVFSGFSGYSSLEVGAKLDKGILSLDSSSCLKDVGYALTNADTWEIGTYIYLVDYTMPSSNFRAIYGQKNTNRATPELTITTSTMAFSVANNLSAWLYQLIIDIVFDLNKWYYIKTFFDGTKYGLEIYNENNILVASKYKNSTTKVVATENIRWGSDTGGSSDFGQNRIDIEKTYIKINGEYWWKGVETL